MLGFGLLALFVFILVVMLVVVITEGFKLTVASVIGFFSLAWAYVLAIWSSYIEYVVEPAINTIMGTRPLDFFGVASVMVFIAWLWVITIAIVNIILTSTKGQPRIFQNLTKDKTDNL